MEKNASERLSRSLPARPDDGLKARVLREAYRAAAEGRRERTNDMGLWWAWGVAVGCLMIAHMALSLAGRPKEAPGLVSADVGGSVTPVFEIDYAGDRYRPTLAETRQAERGSRSIDRLLQAREEM